MNTTSTPASFNSAATVDKSTAIVSYLTLIGFIAAVIMHGTRKTKLGAFHLRQSLGLMLTSIAGACAATMAGFVPFVGWLAALAVWFGLLALWVAGVLAAINAELKPVPVVGIHFQKWFGSAFD